MPEPLHRILLLLPTTTYRAHDFIKAGKRLGMETVVGSEEKATLEDYSHGRTVTLPLSNTERAAAEIAGYAARYPLIAIIPTDEPTAEIAALASERLGLRHNPPAAARATRYKDLLRAALAKAGLPTPKFRVVSVDEDPASAAREQSYPVVLKPVHLSASRGVIKADDPAGFVKAFERIRALLALPEVRDRDAAAAGRILVEEYLPGTEVAVEAMLEEGHLRILALFDKPDPLTGPYFEETLYITPSRLPEATQLLIPDTTARAASALGLIEGPVHAELRVDGDRIHLIEIAARSIGGLCSRTLRFGAGAALEELILLRAAGLKIDSLVREPGAAGVMMLPIPRGGILRGVGGLDSAGEVSGIESITITAVTGQRVVPLPEGSSYLGFLFARGQDPIAVENALREAHRRLTFHIEEDRT